MSHEITGLKLDDEPDASRLQILDRRHDAVVGIVAYGGDVALRQELPRDPIGGISRLDSRRQAAQVGERRHLRRDAPVHRDPLIEREIGFGEPHDRGPVRRDRRARYHRIAGALNEALEDIVEVVALKSDRAQFEPEPGDRSLA